ncbi:MAG TPA: hypothetical protein VG890_00605 [Puia sp.]|nr:hypothetical protein [Puia sp.]
MLHSVLQALRWIIEEVLLTWQCVTYVVIAILLGLVTSGRINVKSIKGASLEVVFADNAKKLGVFESAEFNNMKNLNEDELKLFLIMGGSEAANYSFLNTALTSQASMDMYAKLESDSLFRIERTIHHPNGHDSTFIHPTIIGAKLHRALIQSIYVELIK